MYRPYQGNGGSAEVIDAKPLEFLGGNPTPIFEKYEEPQLCVNLRVAGRIGRSNSNFPI